LNTAGHEARARWDSLTKPRGSLGRLEDAVVKLAEIQGTAAPKLERRALFVFCGDHGIASEGVSAYPSIVTREMVKNFLRGGAAINVLCREYGIETRIVNAGVMGGPIAGAIDRRIGPGTRSFLREPAMSRDETERAIAAGRELAREAAGQFDIAGVGEMGIGNTSSASALVCALTGASVPEAIGRGAGIDDEGLTRKRVVIGDALQLHGSAEPLSTFGGFEIAMMCGFYLGAFEAGLAVVADGFIGGAALLCAWTMEPEVMRGVFVAHRSAEPGHTLILNKIGAEPLFDLGMRLGEGTGAALAIGTLAAALALYRGMSTFAEAAVTDALK
jgi:nicotinate-nucleotide--dimethylbenzimidazole phosphoribosyltransferase